MNVYFLIVWAAIVLCTVLVLVAGRLEKASGTVSSHMVCIVLHPLGPLMYLFLTLNSFHHCSIQYMSYRAKTASINIVPVQSWRRHRSA